MTVSDRRLECLEREVACSGCGAGLDEGLALFCGAEEGTYECENLLREGECA